MDIGFALPNQVERVNSLQHTCFKLHFSPFIMKVPIVHLQSTHTTQSHSSNNTRSRLHSRAAFVIL